MEYFTPYESTIFYSPESLFESAVSLLADRAQLVATNCAITWPEFITPNLLLFKHSDEIISAAVKIGYPQILVFTDINSTTNDSRIININRDDIYKYIDFVRGGIGMTVIEMIMSITIGDNGNKFINVDDARAFCLAITECKNDDCLYTSIANNIAAIVSTIRGADVIEKYISRGRILADREFMGEKIMDDGAEIDNIFYVCADYDTIKQVIPKYLRRYPKIICYKRVIDHWMIVISGTNERSISYLSLAEASVILPIFV